MKKKIISLLVFAVLTISSFPVFASFPDMADPAWDWARGAVDEMVEYGIIKGYGDNTFRPGNNITKGEAMVLFSRVIGYTTDGNEEYIDKAVALYESDVKHLSTAYKGEISYLLYKGILSKDTYLDYAADTVVNTPLKRYEAAEFLTRIATNNAAVNGSISDLSFTDEDITAAMAPYIKYVSDNKIMQGMGDGVFAPEGAVTRAQMTVMLSRILPAISYEYIDGQIKFYNAATDSVIITAKDGSEKEVELIDTTRIYIDGSSAEAQALLTGSKVRVTLSNDFVIAIETISPTGDGVVSGKFAKLEAITANVNGIQVSDVVTGLTTTYSLSKGVSVIKNDKSISAANLVKDDYVVLTIEDGLVVSIVAENKKASFDGKVTDISLTPKFTITILSGGKEKAYEVDANATATRNKKSVSISDILVGDSVSVDTTYGVITEISASSKTSQTDGTITEVIISATPSITVSNGTGNEYTYRVTRDAKITSKGATITFYDLRVGDKVSLDLDAATVKEIEVVSAFANGATEGSSTTISGVVEYVSISNEYIKLVGSSELIFVEKASLTDSTGKAISLKSIGVGDIITVFGTAQVGSYDASMVVVQK